MEVTNDKLLLAFKLKAPLRCFLGGQETLSAGKPCISFAINKFTHALVQVYQPDIEIPKKLQIRFLVRSSNKVIFDFTVRSLSEVLNLTLDDSPEVKVIKHILKNDQVVAPEFKKLLKNGVGMQRVINVKLECDLGLEKGLGGSAGYSLALSCGLVIGLKAAFGLVNNLDQFLEESTMTGQYAIYADYLEQQINEFKGKHTPSGLDVAIAVQAGLIVFSPATEENPSNQILALDHYTFSEHYSLVLINANRKALKGDYVRSQSSYESFDALLDLSEELTGFMVSALGPDSTSFDHDTFQQLLLQQEELHLKYLDADLSEQYDEIKEILGILRKVGYQGVIQGQMILGLTRVSSEEGAVEEGKKERNKKEGMLERELRKSYYSLYGKVAITGDGLYMEAIDLE